MSSMTIFVYIALAALTGGQKLESEKDYRERMQEIDHSFAELSRQRPVRGGPEVEKEAAQLGELFAEIEAYWKGRGDEELAGFAGMAKEGANEARDAARKGETKALEQAIATIAASCVGCHREPLDKYRWPK